VTKTEQSLRVVVQDFVGVAGNVSLCVPRRQDYDSIEGLTLAGNRHPIWDSRRLWSLWDMINFELGMFWYGLETLNGEINRARIAASQNAEGEVPPDEHSRIEQNIQLVTKECVAKLRLEGVATGSCVRLDDMFLKYGHRKYTYRELAEELQRLFNEIKRDAHLEYFFIILKKCQS
jgi:hypothetical protein